MRIYQFHVIKRNRSYKFVDINIIRCKKKVVLYDIIRYIGGEHEKAGNIKIV